MLLTTVSYSGAVCVLCAGSVRVCVCLGGGGRHPVQFKGKIQGTYKAGSAGRKARQGSGNLLSWLTLQPTSLFFGFYSSKPTLVSLCAQPEPGHGKTSFLSTNFQLFRRYRSADKSRRKLLCVYVCADGKELS